MTSAWKTPRILALSVFVLPTRTKAPGSVFARRPPLKVSVEISPTSEFVDSAAMYGCCAAVVAWMNEMPAPVMSADPPIGFCLNFGLIHRRDPDVPVWKVPVSVL